MKQKKIRNILVYVLFFLIVLFFFGMLYKEYYVTDAYTIMGNGLESYSKNTIGNGRWVEYIILSIVKNIDISYINLYRIFLTISAVIISMAMYITYRTFKRENDKGITLAIILLSVFMIFINLAVSEMIIFIECITMSLSILLSIIASKLYNKKKYIFSYLLLLIATLSYQPTITIFIPFSIVLYLKEHKKIDAKEVIKIFVFCYSTLAIMYLLLTIMRIKGIIVDDRIGKNDIFSNILYILDNLVYQCIFVGIYAYIVTVFSKIIPEDKKDMSVNILIISFVSLISTVLLTFGSSSTLSFRMRIALYSVPGFVGIYLYNEIDTFSKKQIKKILILQIIMLVISVSTFYLQIGIYINQNNNTRIMSKEIKEAVEEYESKTGNIITNISYYSDGKKDNVQSILTEYAGGWYSYYVEWSRVPAMKLLLNREIFETEQHEEMVKYFKSNDWKEFSTEQLVFENNTLHFSNY